MMLARSENPLSPEDTISQPEWSGSSLYQDAQLEMRTSWRKAVMMSSAIPSAP